MAKEYIERDALIAEYDRTHIGAPGGARKLMADAPAADVVEVVRCKDCAYREQLGDRLMCRRTAHKSDNGCWFGLRATANEHFCSYGERRTENGR